MVKNFTKAAKRSVRPISHVTDKTATPSLALCSAAASAASGVAIALGSESGAPEWVQLLPAGPTLTGRDDRAWKWLTDAIRALLKEEKVFGYTFEGKRFDAGDKFGMLQATVEFALKRPEFGDKFREYLKGLAL